MPLKLPNRLPAIDLLKKENIFVINNDRAIHQDIRSLKIAVLNLMPLKITSETDLVRLLSNSPLQLELTFVKLSTHIPKNTPAKHMKAFYTPFNSIKDEKFDGMIITGAPVEMLNYEEVNYWEELTMILDWAKTNVTSSMFICWAAQAGLYHYYGIPKYKLNHKIFGIFKHDVLEPLHPIFRGFDEFFFAPHSRYTEVRKKDILKHPELKLLSESNKAGVYLVTAREGREFYIMGHPEYAPYTLDQEYKRDKTKGLDITLPYNYYQDNDSNKPPYIQWRAHANLFYNNWLNYFVYQLTPYNIDDIS